MDFGHECGKEYVGNSNLESRNLPITAVWNMVLWRTSFAVGECGVRVTGHRGQGSSPGPVSAATPTRPVQSSRAGHQVSARLVPSSNRLAQYRPAWWLVGWASLTLHGAQAAQAAQAALPRLCDCVGAREYPCPPPPRSHHSLASLPNNDWTGRWPTHPLTTNGIRVRKGQPMAAGGSGRRVGL